MRVLTLALALLALVAAAPRGADRGSGADGPTILPRGWAIERLRRVGSEFSRVDRVEAKLTTRAEWDRVSASGPLPARPARAPRPGPAPPIVAGMSATATAVATAGATDRAERLVWVVAGSGEVEPPLLI